MDEEVQRKRVVTENKTVEGCKERGFDSPQWNQNVALWLERAEAGPSGGASGSCRTLYLHCNCLGFPKCAPSFTLYS